jgi:hypothetical protein
MRLAGKLDIDTSDLPAILALLARDESPPGDAAD